MYYVKKTHSKTMRLTVASTPQDTAEWIKSAFTTEIKQKKNGTYLLTRTWYQSVKIKISPAPNNGTNVSVSTGYTTAMESALVIATLVLLFLLTGIYLIISVPLLIGLIAAPNFISKPLTEEVITLIVNSSRRNNTAIDGQTTISNTAPSEHHITSPQPFVDPAPIVQHITSPQPFVDPAPIVQPTHSDTTVSTLIQDSVHQGDIVGGDKFHTKVVNDPEAIARAAIKGYEMGKSSDGDESD